MPKQEEPGYTIDQLLEPSPKRQKVEDAIMANNSEDEASDSDSNKSEDLF